MSKDLEEKLFNTINLSVKEITDIVNAFTDIKIPIEAVVEELEMNYKYKKN
jgi:hypothetical protein